MGGGNIHRNVLIISYYFPPSGGSGVQRTAKLVKYIQQFGWEPIVLTVDTTNFPAYDETLLGEIPGGVKVYRTPIWEPYSIYRFFTLQKNKQSTDMEILSRGDHFNFREKLAEKVRSTFFIPDARIGWLPFAFVKGLEIIRKEKINLIYSSAPPYTCHVIGLMLQKWSKLPWVSDFRDPWTEYFNTPRRMWLSRKIDSALEYHTCKNSELIIGTWPGIIEDIKRKYPDLDPGKYAVIYNGYDREDFESKKKNKLEKFTITYSGSIHDKRDPTPFLLAIGQLLKGNRISLNKIKIQFIGRSSRSIRDRLGQNDFSRIINVVDYQNHNENISSMLNSDLLLLLIDQVAEKDFIVPGKLFEYIATGNPILGIGPIHGEAAKLLKKSECGVMFDYQDIAGIVAFIMDCKNGKFKAKHGDEIKSFDRKYQALEMSERFNSLIHS